MRFIALLYFAIRLESRKSANKRIYLSIYHIRPYTDVSIPLQRVTSLRHLAQASVPAALYWLRHVVTTAGAVTRRVRRVRGAGPGAEPAMHNCIVIKIAIAE